MCTILFSWKSTKDFELVLLANRDEFYNRKTKTAEWWADYPNVLGGTDLKAGGSWMGINKNGRFSAITNYRKFPLEEYETSRGELVKNFLIGNDSVDDYMNILMEKGGEYDGFNLLFGNPDELYYYSNRGPEAKLKPSLYGLSNHLLDTPWPKVSRGKDLLKEELKSDIFTKDNMFNIMANNQIADDELLPKTGIGLDKERMLSSIFIKSPDYGTRISTLLTIDKSGNVEFSEKSFVPKNEKNFKFKIT